MNRQLESTGGSSGFTAGRTLIAPVLKDLTRKPGERSPDFELSDTSETECFHLRAIAVWDDNMCVLFALVFEMLDHRRQCRELIGLNPERLNLR